MKKWYLVIDVEKCENCNNCFLSCKDEHVENDWPGYAAPQPGQGPSWITIEGVERGQYPFIDVGYLPAPCMHCDNAPCIKAAKDGAIYKRPDGIVIIDPVKAKGQKNLVNACPYDAIQWNEALMLPQKCTLCAHLLDEGWEKTRCVQSCPTGALSMRHIEDAKMQEMIKTEKLETYQPERKTSPHVYYKNLHRFTRCFIGGSIAVRVDGKDECAEGAKVTLSNGANEKIGECMTDNYGDFKFDNLEENSGAYTLRITYTGYETKTIKVNLTKSVSAGMIFL
ncbi:MAG: oxidoreductase [Deltaproteobacteria bacterium RBG_13_52_11]|nr:MAG: oxidoreductase [Deltaproteobacteria bacterium RBG_13_52_11]